MNQTILTLLFAAGSILSAPAQAWQPAGDKIKTAWADKVDPACPLPEYPRPTLVRPAWQNLNGHWNYAIRPADAPQPELFDGKILVPYPLESSLSGVQRRLAENEVLWYERRFTVPAEWRQGALLLHFGAVDWEADVYLNGIRVGGHKGGYTAPTDEALAYDIIKTKDLGFNMIRKHVKVEPERWYWHCDRLGILVWQDMPNGGPSPEWQNNRYFDGTEAKRTAESEAQFRKEWKEIVDQLYNHPSVAMWVPFNEAWGQFRTEEIARWTKDYDPTRIVNAASGGNFYPDAGEVLDIHSYPHPRFFLFDIGRVNVIGEYGGIGLPLEGHLWQPDQNWGYVRFKNAGEVTDEYVRYAEMLERLIPTGCSGAVYTQTTDVEIEVNGLMTYDRKRMKVDERRLHEVNQRLCRSLGQ